MTRAWAFVASTILAAAAPAWGHGDAHGAPQAAVAKEQQPWGIAAEAREASRTIAIDMGDDMRFRPSRIEVRQGETVRFVVRNRGQLLHEMVIGTREALERHAALMARFPGMQHDEAHMTHVAAGAKGEIVWTFNRPGTFGFACLLPGHFQAGMSGTVLVPPAQGEKS